MKMVELSRAMKSYRLQISGGERGGQTRQGEKKRNNRGGNYNDAAAKGNSLK